VLVQQSARLAVGEPGQPGVRAYVAQALSRCSPHRQAAEQVAHLAIADLDAFLEGYVEGWIPDGWITLG
jgi:hypothetical protein